MLPILRFWTGTLMSLAFVGFAVAILATEVNFELRSISSTATVERYTLNKIWAKFGVTLIGRGGGTAIHLVGGQPVKATFRSYYFHRGPEKGARIPILYLPTDPHFVKVDSFTQRYGPIVFPLILALAAAYWSGIFHFWETHRTTPNGPGLASTGQ